jgi:hypothetical protein
MGTDVHLGDVVIAATTKFHCTAQFKEQSFANESYATSAVPEQALAAITPSLTKVNAKRVVNGRAEPKIVAKRSDAVVTTDLFAFDDSSNHFGLQQLGRACVMGDAMVGLALRDFPRILWYSIRNASDPQIQNASGDMKKASEEAGQIYMRYGAFTTAASVVATWAILSATVA